MSSVAVLTQERFNEHRSGLQPEKSGGESFQISVALQPHTLQVKKVIDMLEWLNLCFTCFGTSLNKFGINDTMSTIDRVLPFAAGGAGAGEEEDALPTYKDAFPPLPEKIASPEGTQDTSNAWNKIRPLKSSIITQV